MYLLAKFARSAFWCVVAAGAAGLAASSLSGCVPIDGGGGEQGTLAGTATNQITADPVAGATVTVDPAVDGGNPTTDDNGAFSQDVPVGVYTVTYSDPRYETQSRTVSVNAGQTTNVDVALAPVQAVYVTAAATGDAVPGATLTANASVEVLDGTATVQSYSWSQSNSVEVQIQNGNMATATVILPDADAYKDELITVLKEPPIGEEDLPPNVPLPEGEFPGGLQDRFQVVGLNPFSLEEAGLVTLEVTVATTSGTFSATVDVHTDLPWKAAGAIMDVPIGRPVLLQGKTQDSYDWSLSRPSGSAANLIDSTTQNPYFTPDLSGLYRVTVTNQTVQPNEVVTLEIWGGTWQGAITGQNALGEPLAANCTVCHNNTIAPDVFTPWMTTGHAEIFSDNLNTSDHYSSNCFVCHTVGYDPGVDNDGMDDQPDYMDFLDSSLLHDTGPNEWTMMLADYPDSARMANIQCENCHGPQNGGAHTMGQPRVSLSADVCATCHGEPLRHARYQQWQLSGHANFELAIDEGESGNCSRCHTANGFLEWLPILQDEDPNTDPLDNVVVTWTADETFPQTCATCHNPHEIGTTTGADTNATVRISGDTPPLVAGFQAFGVGRGAICMTCHNSRRGLRNDENFDETTAQGDASRAPHPSAQADVLMGQNAYFVNVGVRASHSLIQDACVRCHMVETPPPDLLSYNLGGTNHTFFASNNICADCHGELMDADSVEDAFEASASELEELVEDGMLDLIADLTGQGFTIDLNGQATITSPAQIAEITFGESHGRQAITVTLTNGTTIGPVGLNSVEVLDSGTGIGELYDFADSRLIKSGWNLVLAENDGSHGVHNPPWVFEFLDVSIDQMQALLNE